MSTWFDKLNSIFFVPVDKSLRKQIEAIQSIKYEVASYNLHGQFSIAIPETKIIWKGLEALEIKLVDTFEGAPIVFRNEPKPNVNLNLVFEILGTKFPFSYGGLWPGLFHCTPKILHLKCSTKQILNVSLLKFVNLLKPSTRIPFDFLVDEEQVTVESCELNMTNQKYTFKISTKQVFKTKSFDINVSEISFLTDHVCFNGMIPSLGLKNVSIRIWERGDNLISTLSSVEQVDRADIPQFTFISNSFPIGVIPDKIFDPLPNQVLFIPIKVTSLSCDLDVSSQFAIIHDRRFVMQFGNVEDYKGNLLEDPFPGVNTEWKTSILTRIQWAVFGLEHVVTQFDTYLSNLLDLGVGKPSKFSLPLRAQYANNFVLSANGPFEKNSQYNCDYMFQFIMRHYFNMDIAEFVPGVLKSWDHAFIKAYLDIRYRNFNITHRITSDGLQYTFNIDFRTGWNGATLEWEVVKLLGPKNLHPVKKYRQMIFEGQFRNRFQNNLLRSSQKAYDLGFHFLHVE